MAHNTLAVPSEPFSTDRFTNHIIEFIDRQLALQPYMKLKLEPRPMPLHTCSYESPESTPGARDGGLRCLESGTIFDLESDQPFCGKHFGRN